MIHFKINRYILVLILIFVSTIFTSCEHSPSGQTDYSETKLNKTVDSIKIGEPFAKQRVEKWRKTMHLYYINVGFTGKMQIKNRKGEISYFYYESNIENNFNADAQVEIDMNKNSIDRFVATYGNGKELGVVSATLNTGNWRIGINEAFEIALKELGGENKILQYNNPKVVLRCWQTFWDFAVYSEPNARFEDLLVVINPETSKVIEVKDNTKIKKVDNNK